MIVVTGASGQLGRHVIEGLLDTVPASEIVAAVRDPARVEAFADRGVQVRRADYDEPDTLTEAFWDADRVLLISSNDYSRSAAQHSVVIEAAKRAGVRLLVYTSLTHADTTTLKAAIPHWATEQVIRDSGVPFTILRNNVYSDAFTPFMQQALASGTLVGSAGDGRVAAATRADYAAAAVAVLTGVGHAGKVYELTADSAWSFADMAAELSKAAGKGIAFQGIPTDQHREILIGIGLPALVADVFVDTTRAIAAREVSETTGQLRALIGRPTTTLAQLVEQVVSPSKGRPAVTTNDHVVRYHEHVSTKSYEELVAAFEDAVDAADPAAIADTVTAASNSTDSRQTWETATKSPPGSSGFLRVLALNTGELASWYGKPAKAKMYIVGNPLIAATMLIHDIRVAGRVPLQILIYADDNGQARLSYDLPSTLMSRFGNAELDAAARELDKKLVTFATELTGAAP